MTSTHCANRFCPCDSFDGDPAMNCCRQCENGTACLQRRHVLNASHVPQAQQEVRSTSDWHQPHRRQQQQETFAATALIPSSPQGARLDEPHRHATACARWNCSCDSWNGSVGEYCCYTCRQGTPCTLRYHTYTRAPNASPAVPGQAAGRRSHSTNPGAVRGRSNREERQSERGIGRFFCAFV